MRPESSNGWLVDRISQTRGCDRASARLYLSNHGQCLTFLGILDYRLF